MKVGTACRAFLCIRDGDLKGLCHGDDFCIIGTTEAVAKSLEKSLRNVLR